jgi:hypothetical protein
VGCCAREHCCYLRLLFCRTPQEAKMDNTTLLIIIILLVVFLGGGWYGRGRWY